MKRICILFLITLGTAALPVAAQQRHELTVREAVELAYKNVIELKNAELDYRIQEAKNKEIFGQALPQLSANVQASRFFEVPVFPFPNATESEIYRVLKQEGISGINGPITNVPPPTIIQAQFQQPWNLVAGPTITQLLFQPDVFVGLQARKTALQYSRAVVEQTKERIKDSAYRRYYAILVAEKQAYFLAESVKRLERLYADDSVMFKNGFAERLDLDKVQVQINNLKNSQNLVNSAVQLSYAALKFALGIPQKDTVVLKEELSTTALKDGLLDESFRYENRAEIRTLIKARELQTLDLKRNRLGYLPTVSASANRSYNNLGQKFFTSSENLSFPTSFVGLNIALPIFDGFQRKYRVQQSRLNLEKVDNSTTNLKQAIDFEQTLTKEQLKTSLANVDLSESNLQLAEKVYNTTKLKFEQGLGSSFEVLQADTDLQTAQANYFNALYNAITAKISYQYALGKLQ